VASFCQFKGYGRSCKSFANSAFSEGFWDGFIELETYPSPASFFQTMLSLRADFHFN
jgi:hypothetical protein